jgi:hypothetical protein
MANRKNNDPHQKIQWPTGKTMIHARQYNGQHEKTMIHTRQYNGQQEKQ